ncbi:MAG TPA: DUF6456 domain-containing protein [Paracoccaceae bacterium]
MTTIDGGVTTINGPCDPQPPGCAPAWVPQDALRYLAHTEAGLPIRALARSAGCHASTVLRQIRRLENRRDDLLVDEALRRLGTIHFTRAPAKVPVVARPQPSQKEVAPMQTECLTQTPTSDTAPSYEVLRREARRVLRRLAEPGAVLAVATEMDKAVVVRDIAGGATTRTAVVDRPVAQAMALKEWIACDAPGRISRYRITGLGRTALATLMAEAENMARRDLAEGQARFAGQGHPTEGDIEDDTPPTATRRRMRYCVNESPLLALSRRRDKAGKPFLSDELVAAGERLREDFELSQMGPKVAQNWDRFLTAGVQGGAAETGLQRGPEAARTRIGAALRDLGPGLGDVALRCCCYLEGLEQAERRMGWSARSGKIVLRIALQRLRRHYDDQGQAGSMIG